MRKVIITNSSYLIGFDDLSRHPAVKKCWLLPHEYTLFELTDPVLASPDIVRPPSPQMAADMVEEAAFFAPFYTGLRSLADIKALHIAGHGTSYHLVTVNRTQLQWPATFFQKNWDVSSSLRIACRLRRKSLEDLRVLRRTFLDWQTCMEQLGQRSRCGAAEGGPGRYAAHYHFTSPCGDPTMALLMLLTHTSPLTSLKSVAFLPSNHLSLRIREEEGQDFN